MRYDDRMDSQRLLWGDRQCEVCQEELFCEGLFCPTCQREIDKLLYPVASRSEGYVIASMYHYDGLIRDLLRRMKFQEGRYLSRFFAGEIVRFLKENEMFAEVVSWIPMHRRKERRRGFDHAKDLAVETAKMLDIPFLPILRRAKPTRALYSLTAKERIGELKGAFEAALKEDERLWLVLDDILTTGSTIDEAAKILQEATIVNFVFLVIAR